MNINVAEIVISATDKTKEGFESVHSAMDTLKEHSLALAETLGVMAFGEMIKGSMETADQLNKMSQSTGVSVESLSRLSLSAKLSDVDMETLAKGMEKLSKNINDASQGTGKAAGAFDYLGISATDSAGHLKNSDQIMGEVADKFANLQDGAGKTALAMDIFGKAGAGMIPMLNKGSEELKANAEMSDRLGLTLSTQTARGAEEVNDRFTLMGQGVHGLANTAMTQLLPTIDKISKMFVDAATDTDNLHRKFAVLDGSIKSLITVGIIVKDVFAEVGTVLGGVAAASVMALQGNFSGASEALKSMSSDMVDTMSADIESVAKLWADDNKIPEAVKDAAKKAVDGYAAVKIPKMKAVRDQEYIDIMAAFEQELKDEVFYGQKHQKNLNDQLANMLISEKDFSEAKKKLVLDDLNNEAQVLAGELAMARYKNDNKKAIEIEGRIERNKIAQEEASGPTAYDAKANKAAMSALDLEKKSYQDRLDLAETYRKNNGDADGRAKQMEMQAQTDHEAAMTSIIQRGAVTRNDFEAMSGKQQLQTHLALLSNMLNASAQHSRAAFEAMKIVKLAEAAIALPSTVMKAYESGMAAGGPAGPAVGAAYAALAFATQMIQMNAIQSASFGGGASAGAAPSGGGVSSSAIPGQAANPNVVSAQPTAPANQVQVIIQGNVMTQDFINNTVIPQIQSQVQNADVVLIDPRSRQASMLAVPA